MPKNTGAIIANSTAVAPHMQRRNERRRLCLIFLPGASGRDAALTLSSIRDFNLDPLKACYGRLLNAKGDICFQLGERLENVKSSSSGVSGSGRKTGL